MGFVASELRSVGRVSIVNAGTGILAGLLHRAGVDVQALGFDIESAMQCRRSVPSAPVAVVVADPAALRPRSAEAVLADLTVPGLATPALITSIAVSAVSDRGLLIIVSNADDTVAPEPGFIPEKSVSEEVDGLDLRTVAQIWRRDGANSRHASF